MKEVREHTEWINSIAPVKKSDGSLRLCLDPKDLNQAIKRNQWYSRTVDYILPELADCLARSRGIGTSLLTKTSVSWQPSIHPGASTDGYAYPLGYR